jgi:hypothetical protein
MQIAALSTSSGYLRWLSRCVRFTFPFIITSGTNSRWAAGHLPLAHVTTATNSFGMVAMASSRSVDHFTLGRAVLRNHRQSPMSSLMFLLQSILFSVSSVSFSRTETPNHSLEPTALWRCASKPILISLFSTGAEPRSQSGGSAPSR